MQAVVLAGGLGTRVRSITSAPKCLLPVSGKPVIDHIIDACFAQGVEEVIVAAGYRGDMVSRHVRDKYAHAHVDVVQEPSPLGTAGALLPLRNRLRHPFLLLNGDTLFKADLIGLMLFHKRSGALATMGLTSQARREDAGNVAVTSLPGWILNFSEKQPLAEDADLINAGIYAVSPALVKEIHATPCSLEHNILPELVSDHALAGYPVSACYDIGTVERFKEVDIRWVGENR